MAGGPLITSDEEIKDGAKGREYAKIYYPDQLRGEMPEVVPNDINNGIQPENGRQGDQGYESHEYGKCDQLRSFLHCWRCRSLYNR